MKALHTDLYQLTMAAGYYQAGKSKDRATFEMFVRRMPYNRNFFLTAGLAQAVEYILNLRFEADQIDYLRSLRQFQNASAEFFEGLTNFRFTGDVFAVAEGTPIFAGEPFLTVRAPMVEAQLLETYLLSMIGFQTTIATKAARISEAAGTAGVVEFGSRRAHSPDAGVLAGRAAYIGGCVGTSNVEAGFRYGVPVFGTAAHSWVMSFQSETTAFEQLQQLLGDATVYLIDSYDTLQGARTAAGLGKPMWGVRLDSGNLLELARKVRVILDQAGFTEAKIMATGDLNEYRIIEMVAAGAPIDLYGVGTDLATSIDCPSLGAVYKLVELDENGVKRFTAKFSLEKRSMPGAKQIFRYADHDEVACEWECPTGDAEALLRPVILNGQLAEPLPDLAATRSYAASALKKLPRVCRSLYGHEDAWKVKYSSQLLDVEKQVRNRIAGVGK